MTDEGVHSELREELLKQRLVSVQMCEWAGLLPDGRAVVSGTFDRLSIPQELWGTQFSFFLLVKGCDTHEKSFHVSIYNPDATMLGQFDMPTAPYRENEQELKYSTVIARLNIAFTQSGIHWFEVSYDDVFLGRHGFTVGVMGADKDADASV